MKREETFLDVVMAENNIRTNKDMAEKLGISQASFSARINGEISMNTLELFSKFFNKPIKELLR